MSDKFSVDEDNEDYIVVDGHKIRKHKVEEADEKKPPHPPEDDGHIGKEPANAHSSIKKVIGVVSGKGGVGKSMVTALSAVLMHRRGYRAGILDADITGPSIPKMFGIERGGGVGKEDENEIIPGETATGIKVMSLNLLMPNETDPVIWRGPVIAGVVKQFWKDVVWGDLDFLFVDMPPGTGDVPLTVFQSLPVDGIVIVSTPQQLVSMIVEKAIKMAEMMEIPIVGLVENMSWMLCPHCKKPIYPFGDFSNDAGAVRHGVDVVGRLPMDPVFSEKADSGKVEEIDTEDLDLLVGKLSDLMEDS